MCIFLQMFVPPFPAFVKIIGDKNLSQVAMGQRQENTRTQTDEDSCTYRWFRFSRSSVPSVSRCLLSTFTAVDGWRHCGCLFGPCDIVCVLCLLQAKLPIGRADGMCPCTTWPVSFLARGYHFIPATCQPSVCSKLTFPPVCSLTWSITCLMWWSPRNCISFLSVIFSKLHCVSVSFQSCSPHSKDPSSRPCCPRSGYCRPSVCALPAAGLGVLCLPQS